MTSPNTAGKRGNREFDYLCVDDFISNIFSARALATAFEIRLIDLLLQNKHATLEAITEQLGTDGRGMGLLVRLLLENRVVEDRNGILELSKEFSHALQFRDLLELKLGIANFAAHDFLNYFSTQVSRPGEFMGKARFCRLFSYDRCFEATRENYESTRQWMRITTALTKYEAQACIRYHDFSRYRRILDIGGNSGEFVLRICKAHPGIQSTVFDLPLVCDIGLEHIQSEPEADRISFIKGNALTDALPTGFDLITFKSMLHDWPEKEARQFIARAAQSLTPGGTLLIFERGPIEDGEAELSYATIPMLLFFHSFRSPALYQEQFRELGLQDITVKKLYLETPFFIATAEKRI
ncbi:MAG: methyltransferase domain-containing protein [Syntrophobacterales bacterium]|nr:MAG: methyltransferase domain-containing protein [Syntrophobacterales bacterium]